MDKRTAVKASRLLLAIEELERFEDQLVDLLESLEDEDNHYELTSPIRELVGKVIEKRNAELEGL
jgi:hypothetical protein